MSNFFYVFTEQSKKDKIFKDKRDVVVTISVIIICNCEILIFQSGKSMRYFGLSYCLKEKVVSVYVKRDNKQQ